MPNPLKYTVLGALASACLLFAALSGPAQADPDLSPANRSHCVALGFELGDRVVAKQKMLADFKAQVGATPTDEQSATIAEIADYIDNLDTMSGGLIAIYFDGANFPSDEDLAVAKALDIGPLLDQATVCVTA